MSLQATALFAKTVSYKSSTKLVRGFPACNCVGQREMSPIYHVKMENLEKETKKHRRSVPFNTHVSAEVTAMTLSWRRARAPRMHLLEIPPRLQAGILRHMLTARPEEAGAQAETTRTLGPLATCSDKLPGTAKEVTAGRSAQGSTDPPQTDVIFRASFTTRSAQH